MISNGVTSLGDFMKMVAKKIYRPEKEKVCKSLVYPHLFKTS